LEWIVGIELPRPVGEGGLGNYALTSERLWLLPVVTGLGGLLSGLLVYSLAPEAEGHGTDAAINAYHRLRGRIRRRVPFVKLVASAVTIGSGGSAGREGPTAQLSAGLGSIIADVLRLNDDDRRIVTMAAAGAGIGTIFKAPIGGALFAAEVLYKRDIESEVLFPALVAAIVGYAIYGAITGFTPVFGEVPARFDVKQLPLFALLGLVSGAVAYVYVKVFYYFHDRFKSWHISPYIKPLVGGLAVGALGIAAPQILGVGYGWVSLLIQESPSAFYSPILPAVLLMALLPFLKILATSLTVGSGGSGGVFAPGLVIGAFVGYDTYLVFKILFPSLAPSAAPFVIVGMLSLFGAASKAPLATAIMVLR